MRKVCSSQWSTSTRSGRMRLSFLRMLVMIDVPLCLSSRCGVWMRINWSCRAARSTCCSKTVTSLRVFLFNPISPTPRYARVVEQRGDQLDHFAAERNVLGFLGVDAQPGVVVDAVFGRAFRLDVEQVAEIIGEAGGAGPIEAGPERRLRHRHHAGTGHVQVVVGGAADAVDVRVDVFHIRVGQGGRPLPSAHRAGIQSDFTVWLKGAIGAG